MKRKGFSKSADLTIATGPVAGSHSFIDSSGNRLDIVCQDRNCAKSTNGNAFATFLTTAAAGITRWSFVDQGGILYGANNKYDPIMRYDGTTRTSPVGMPLGSILELTQDRLAIGDIQSLPNRVHYSSAGAYEQFTTGVNPEDSFFDDIGTAGDKVRGIRCIGGNCFIFKTASITLCEMSNQYNTQCSVISPNIGTTDPASIVAAGSVLYFRAQDKNYWAIDRGSLRQISQKIPNLVKSQSGGLGGGENTNTQTTQADWASGTQKPSFSWDYATNSGSVFPSSVTLVDSSSSNFSAGTLVNVSTNSTAIFMAASTTDTFVWENWPDAAGTMSPSGRWSLNNTDWSVNALNPTLPTVGGTRVACRSTANQSDATETNAIYRTGASSTGRWGLSVYTRNSNAGPSIMLLYEIVRYDANNLIWLQIDKTSTIGISTIRLYQKINGVTTQQGGSVSWTTPSENLTAFEIVRDTNAFVTVFRSGSSIITSTTSNSFFPIAASIYLSLNANDNSSDCSNPDVAISSVSIPFYVNGVQFSRVFDTSFSTPTGGAFSVSSMTPAGTSLAFQHRSSANGSTGWTLWTNITNGNRVFEQSHYWQYLSSFTTTIATQTPRITFVSLIAATTGQFITQCIQPNSSISSWGTLSCAETKTGNASLVYYATSAASCATLPVSTAPVNNSGAVQAGWVQQTNNGTVSIATNVAVFIGFRSLLTSATEQAQVDSCVLAWNEGTPAQPSWAVYDSIKNSIYWTATVGGASSTNRLLKYDRNLEEWYPFDIPAQAPRIINNSLYFGGASSGTWNLYGMVDSDAGGAINGYWKSKDIGSDSPFREKSFQRLSILSRNSVTGSMTGTYSFSNASGGSYSISLSTGAGISYARNNYLLPLSSPHEFINVKVGNTSATPFEVLGIGVTWETKPWRVSGP